MEVFRNRKFQNRFYNTFTPFFNPWQLSFTVSLKYKFAHVGFECLLKFIKTPPLLTLKLNLKKKTCFQVVLSEHL